MERFVFLARLGDHLSYGFLVFDSLGDEFKIFRCKKREIHCGSWSLVGKIPVFLCFFEFKPQGHKSTDMQQDSEQTNY